jgi:hypothetical protein
MRKTKRVNKFWSFSQIWQNFGCRFFSSTKLYRPATPKMSALWKHWVVISFHFVRKSWSAGTIRLTSAWYSWTGNILTSTRSVLCMLIIIVGAGAEPGPLDLRRYLVRSCVVYVPLCGRGGGGRKAEGRYEEKTEAPLPSFEVRSNCVFSSTFGKTLYPWLTDPKKTKDLRTKDATYFLSISFYSCDWQIGLRTIMFGLY